MNPRLIALEEEEAAALRAMVEDICADYIDHYIDHAPLLDAIAARYEDGLTMDEVEAAIHILTHIRDEGPGLSEYSGSALKKLGRILLAFTPPTQRSDSE